MSGTQTKVSRLDACKQEIVEVGRFLGGLNFHGARAGNLSMRVSEDRLLCSRHGADKRRLTAEDLILCDLEGRKVAGEGQPTSEINMHRMSYATRPDVRGVIHAHPPTATGFAAASVPLDRLQLPEMLVLLGPVALVPYATPGSEELAEQLKRFLPTHDGFLLENHGALTVGATLQQAAIRMELIEQHARQILVVKQIGKPYTLRKEDLERLLEIRKKMTVVPPPFDEEL